LFGNERKREVAAAITSTEATVEDTQTRKRRRLIQSKEDVFSFVSLFSSHE
jgi:hypothetical protein